jgi:hypothetical protein
VGVHSRPAEHLVRLAQEEGRGRLIFQLKKKIFNLIFAYKVGRNDTIIYANGEDVHLIRSKGKKYDFFIYKRRIYTLENVDRILEEPIDTINWTLNGAETNMQKILKFNAGNYEANRISLNVGIPIQIAKFIEGDHFYPLPIMKNDLSFNIILSNNITSEFMRSKDYSGEYGFYNEFTTCDQCYKSIVMNGVNYKIPWISLSQNKVADLNLFIKIDPDQYKALKKENESFKIYGTNFIINGAVDSLEILFSQLREGEYRMPIRLVSTMETTGNFDNCDSIYAKMGQDIIGKAYYYTKDFTHFNERNAHIVRIFVNDLNKSQFNINIPNTTNYFNNNSYNQAFVKWNVTQEVDVTISWDKDSLVLKQLFEMLYNLEWDKKPETNYSQIYYDLKNGKLDNSYSPDVIQHFLSNFHRIAYPDDYTKYISDENHLIFVSDMSPNVEIGGIGSQPGKVSVIYKSCKDDYSIYVHEIAHNLYLGHAFDVGNNPSERGVPKGSGNNFMNYFNSGILFWETQWKHLFDKTK